MRSCCVWRYPAGPAACLLARGEHRLKVRSSVQQSFRPDGPKVRQMRDQNAGETGFPR
jgi:hypothetical protein